LRQQDLAKLLELAVAPAELDRYRRAVAQRTVEELGVTGSARSADRFVEDHRCRFEAILGDQRRSALTQLSAVNLGRLWRGPRLGEDSSTHSIALYTQSRCCASRAL
jgi:hypothetical protein